MTLLADFISKDPLRVWSASATLRMLRDPKQLSQLAGHCDEIRAATQDLPVRGEDAASLEFALRKLEHVHKARECLCALYLTDDLFNPQAEARMGNIRILEVNADGNYIENYACQCTLCGARYQVEENDYYHTWWAWRLAKPASLSAMMRSRQPVSNSLRP